MKVWIATQETDCACYNLLSRTKKELQERLRAIETANVYREAWQIDVDTSDAFELARHLTGEDGGRGSQMGDVIAHYQIMPDGAFKRIPNNTYIDFDGNVREF